MDLETIKNKMLNEMIKIETVHDDALGMEIIITCRKIEIENNKMKINNYININFDAYKICDIEECSNVLVLYHEGTEIIYLHLLEHDSWV